MNRFEDSLEPVGVAVGALLVLIGLTTLVGMPWSYKPGIAYAIAQVLGAAGTAAVGAGLAWLSWTDR